MKKTLALICLISTVIEGLCKEPPTLQCLQLLNDNTQLRIHWNNSADCANFAKYLVYVNGMPVDSILPTDVSTNRLCDTGELVINNIPVDTSYNCYLEAIDANNQSCVSNTLQTMSVTVTASADSGFAYISWPPPHIQPGTTWGNNFYLYKKREFERDFSNTPFATVPATQLSYIDTADVCHANISYQVGITNHYSESGNCIFKTDIGTVKLIDRTRPATPVLDSVSTTEDNRIILGFHSPDDYMFGYIIYYHNNGWETIDTALEDTYWISPDRDAHCYRIAVLDSCFNSSEINDKEQCNIILSIQSTDACNRTASLSWNEYVNMQSGTDHYEVFTSTDNGTTWQSAGTTINTSLQLDSLKVNTPYLAFVRIYNTTGNITASSNRAEFALNYDTTNDFSYVRSVSVIDNQYIKVTVHTGGDTLPFKSITLQRSSDGINFTDFQTLPHTTSATYEFVDTLADFERQTYYYRTFIADKCNLPTGKSNISHNILLSGKATNSQTNLLQWNEYGTWNGGVENYYINRKLETEPYFNDLTATTANTYEDNVSQHYNSGSKFTYYVEARERLDEYGFADVSTSNFLTLRQLPNTFIPNAFTPAEAINNIFQPVNSFVPTDNYQLTVYTRFGNIAFRTRDPYTGWDGRIDGKLAPMDIYVYRITYNFPDGTPYEKVGSVTLIY